MEPGYFASLATTFPHLKGDLEKRLAHIMAGNNVLGKTIIINFKFAQVEMIMKELNEYILISIMFENKQSFVKNSVKQPKFGRIWTLIALSNYYL